MNQLKQLCQGVQSQDFRSLAQMLTALESLGPMALESENLLQTHQASFRIGLTGPPGAGKSTLINELIKSFRQKDWTIGVIAVDPSSPLSQGAILGDRIRYSEHFADKNVFIRSLGTRGGLGGLSSSAYLMLRAYDLFGFDVVLIETVGVGQSELEIVNVADSVGVVLVPESGDSIQIMKAGILEIANFYIINKADRPGAKSLSNELKFQCGLPTTSTHQTHHPSYVQHGKPHNHQDNHSPKAHVFETIATTGEGIPPLVDFLEKPNQQALTQIRVSPEKLRQEARALLKAQHERDLQQHIHQIESLEDFRKLVTTKPIPEPLNPCEIKE